MFTRFLNFVNGLGGSRLVRSLTADMPPHAAGETTHRMWSVGVFGANAFMTGVRRTRGIRAALGRRLRRAADRLTRAALDIRAYVADDDLAGIRAAHARLAEHRASGRRRFLDSRVSRALAVVIAIVVVVVDYGFLNGLARDLFAISFAEFDWADLGEFVVIWVLPVFFPVVTIMVAEVGGRLNARARAAKLHADRMATILPGGLPADLGSRARRWLLLASAVGAGVFFFVMATIRFGAAAEDAGLEFPAWLVATIYGLLPIAALYAVAFSLDPVLDHERALARAVRRGDARRRRLENRMLAARRALHTAWFALARLIDRLVADGSGSIRLVEQLYADAYAETRAIGDLAPIVPAAPVRPVAATAFTEPELAPTRGLTMPVAPWITVELERDLELLRAYRPDADFGGRAATDLSALFERTATES